MDGLPLSLGIGPVECHGYDNTLRRLILPVGAVLMLGGVAFAGERAEVKPLVTRNEKPADYDNDLDRGTVEYREGWKNYSFHKVRIPGGTIVTGCNFAQAKPRTDCIEVTGVGVVTFRECNLSNVELTARMVSEKCLTAQSWIVEEDVEAQDDKGQPVTVKQETRRVIADHPSKVSKTEAPPSDAIVRKEDK